MRQKSIKICKNIEKDSKKLFKSKFYINLYYLDVFNNIKEMIIQV